MLQLPMVRFRQGRRTAAYPEQPPELPDRFRGRPTVDAAKCPQGCRECVDACPTSAVAIESTGVSIDLGRCLFCTDCVQACPHGAIAYTPEYRLSVRRREDLILRDGTLKLAEALDARSRSLFGRSLKLRQVSAGGCNACEADLNVLSTVVFDLSRFGIQFVASPRHADGLVVTGPVSRNMHGALLDTYAAVPAPKFVVAVGACSIGGGPYIDNPEVHNGCGALLPVDLYVPGCPPHPWTILDGLLRLLGRIGQAPPSPPVPLTPGPVPAPASARRPCAGFPRTRPADRCRR
jgi:Ni,Fe-hydrogenase III small subunit/Pyruvate/2-oxoacid:ferredoxin oxidoreductase delta subunit